MKLSTNKILLLTAFCLCFFAYGCSKKESAKEKHFSEIKSVIKDLKEVKQEKVYGSKRQRRSDEEIARIEKIRTQEIAEAEKENKERKIREKVEGLNKIFSQYKFVFEDKGTRYFLTLNANMNSSGRGTGYSDIQGAFSYQLNEKGDLLCMPSNKTFSKFVLESYGQNYSMLVNGVDWFFQRNPR